MSDVPISVFVFEDLNRDFVWLVRKPEFADVARPKLEQCQPRPINGEAFEFLILNEEGQKVKTFPMIVANAPGGRINVFADKVELGLLKKRGPFTYHVLATKNGVEKSLFNGTFEITLT
jgi:hypothetical protein